VSPAKADANKADAASPFALLVEMATAKDGAKPAKKDAKDSGDKPADSKSAVKQNDGSQNGVKQDDNIAAAQTAPQPKASAKPGKPDKNKSGEDDIETVQSAPDDKQIAAVEQQMSDQQALPPAPVVQASIQTITDSDADEDLLIDGVASPAPVTSSDTDFDAPEHVGASAKPEASATAQSHAAPQTPVAALADDDQTEEPQLPASAAARARAVLAARDESTPPSNKPSSPSIVPGGPKPPANAAPGATVKPDTTNTDSAGSGGAASEALTTDANKATPEIAMAQADPAAKSDLAKSDAIRDSKNGLAKGHLAQDGVAKSDASGSDADKGNTSTDTTTASRLDPVPVERDDANGPSAPRPAPQSAQMSNAGFAISNIAAPQAGQHSQAPTATQHVQVTAQAAPNLPALAVEIAAKSQSGAKQFDIRLDPPELGRVEVRLSIDATGKASAHLSADQPQTLALLQKDAPVLTRALREAGLDVSQDGLNFSLRHQSGGQSGNDSNNGRFGNSRAFSLAATASIDPTASTIAYRGLVDGRLDIRV